MKRDHPSKYQRLRWEMMDLREQCARLYGERNNARRDAYHEMRERFEQEHAMLKAENAHLRKLICDAVALQPMPRVSASVRADPAGTILERRA